MRFCPECANTMILEIKDTVSFTCSACSKTVPGDPSDYLVLEQFMNTDRSEDIDLSSPFIQLCAFDPTNPVERKPCEKCNIPFMRYCRVGNAGKKIYGCTCGYITD